MRFEATVPPSAAGVAKGRRLEGRAGDIMQAARALFETKGVSATTVKDIAAEAHITRELFYYYFSGKGDVIEAVIDDYAADIVESVAVWNEMRRFGDMPAALRDCVATLRRTLYDANGPRPMIAVLEELGMRDSFDVRAVRETAEFFCQNVAGEYERYHDLEIEFLFEMFCVMLFGLVGLLKINPRISDDALMKVVEQTLRLDMKPPVERTE
ncbi:MAG: TetR/AcrR family transcriptional regulator [Slackia sp.]|nr:TetR/AcrR family transcriptional regulator [Slackia sp.]